MTNGAETPNGYVPGGIGEVVHNTLPGAPHAPSCTTDGYSRPAQPHRRLDQARQAWRTRTGTIFDFNPLSPQQELMNRNDITEKIITVKVPKG
jgi:hypothetical protein